MGRTGELVSLDERRADAALRARMPAQYRWVFDADDGNWVSELAAALGVELALRASPETLLAVAELLAARGAR